MAYNDDDENDDDDDLLKKAEEEAACAEKAAAMVAWTKRCAFFLGFCAFIVMFMLSYDFENYADTKVIVKSIIMGLGAFLLLWVSGLIIGNIFLRGLITDIPVEHEHLVDGGILQRIYLYQQRLNYDEDGNVIQVDPRTDTIVRKNAKSK